MTVWEQRTMTIGEIGQPVRYFLEVWNRWNLTADLCLLIDIMYTS